MCQDTPDSDRVQPESASTKEEREKERDAEIKQIQEERLVYARLHALTGNFICVYVVDPETDHYREFSATDLYSRSFEQAKEGTDFFDTVRDEEFMEIYTNDLNGLVKNDLSVCRLVQNAAKQCGKDVPFGSIPLGSTDAAAASRAGCKAASFVAMDPAPARYYHTRLDTADNILPSTIEKGVEIALQTVFDFDEKGLG